MYILHTYTYFFAVVFSFREQAYLVRLFSNTNTKKKDLIPISKATVVRQANRILMSSTNVSAASGCTEVSTWHFPCKQTTLYPCDWLDEHVAWKVKFAPQAQFQGKAFSQITVLSSITICLGWLWLAMLSGRMLRAFCPRSFFSYSMQRTCHQHSSLVVLLHTIPHVCP